MPAHEVTLKYILKATLIVEAPGRIEARHIADEIPPALMLLLEDPNWKYVWHKFETGSRPQHSDQPRGHDDGLPDGYMGDGY